MDLGVTCVEDYANGCPSDCYYFDLAECEADTFRLGDCVEYGGCIVDDWGLDLVENIANMIALIVGLCIGIPVFLIVSCCVCCCIRTARAAKAIGNAMSAPV